MSPACTSRETHNGCRVLFNHTQGWAYMGPSGLIDPKEFPGTVAYSLGRAAACGNPGAGCNQTRRMGDRAATKENVRRPRGNHALRTPAVRSGQSLARKTNEVLSAFFDGACLDSHLAEAGVEAGQGDEGRGTAPESDAGEDGGSGSRKGLPIVLTLQAILTGDSSCTGNRFEGGSGQGSSPAGEGSQEAVANDSDPRGGSDGPPYACEGAQFPPLSSSPELFLAPPIMVKPDGGGSAGGGLSCAEVVAASSAIATETAVSMAQPAGTGVVGSDGSGSAGEEKVSGMSRVGWWLRWAVTGSGGADADAGDVGASSSGETSNGGDRGAIDGAVSYEVRGGSDGWELVSVGTGASDGEIALPPADLTARLSRFGECIPGSSESLTSPVVDGDGFESMEYDTDERASSWDYCGMSDVDVSDVLADRFVQMMGARHVDLEGSEEQDAGSDAEGDEPTAEEAAPTRLSYRDALMMPSSRGKASFALSQSVLARRAERRRALLYKRPPRLIPETGLYLWRQMASGMARPGEVGRGRNGGDDVLDDEGGCEYYATKEWGAISFAKRPRGRDHK